MKQVCWILCVIVAVQIAAEDSPREAWESDLPIPKVQQMVRDLQVNPLGNDADALRSLLYVYFDGMRPEFVVCLEQIGPLLKSKKKPHEDLWIHLAISSGSYLLESAEFA